MIINDQTNPADYAHPLPNGSGYVERNYGTHPQFYSPRSSLDFPLIPRDQWAEMIREGNAKESFLSHIRRRGVNGSPIPALDQGNRGYCWMHSGTMAAMLVRAKNNQPYVRLSAYMGACIIKNYRDEGGWGAQGLDWLIQNGVPSVEFWPERSVSRSNDTPEMRANAALHKVSESWFDLTAAQYDRNFTEDQAMTLLLMRTPVIADFNGWSHSVCLMDPVLNPKVTPVYAIPDLTSLDFNDPKDREVFGDLFGKKGINSWSDNWGDLGEFTLAGSKAHLDGGSAPGVVNASTV